MAEMIHNPVMLNEMLSYLNPKDGGVYVDATFGAGGYSKAILEKANCKIYAIDRDPNVKKIVADLAEKFPGRIEFVFGCFGNIRQLLKDKEVDKIDGLVLDIGVSSMQLDNAERGFSFKQDGPLDMRMSSVGMTAEDVVNSMKEAELADVIYEFGGEKKSRQVAKAIVTARGKNRITTTKQLADIVRSVVSAGGQKIDPATRTFQALRIYINDELGELLRALEASENLINLGGRVVVVTFHSLEDGIVKKFFRDKSGVSESFSRHFIVANENKPKAQIFSLVNKKVILPSEKEINENVRARSAKMRVAERVG